MSSLPYLPSTTSKSDTKPPTRAYQLPVSSASALPPPSNHRRVTHIPPPPIPQWALASRLLSNSAPAQRPLPATDGRATPPILPAHPPQTPSGLEHPTRPTALLSTTPSRGSLHPRIAGPSPEIPRTTAPVEHTGPDSRGRRERGRSKGSKNRTDAPADLLARPRPKRVEARPDYRVRKKREKYPKKRQFRSPSPTPREIYDGLDPLFVHFICEWEGCRAELDSFAKLKKHIVVAHGDQLRGTKQCRLGKCSHLNDDATDMAALPRVFASVEDLLCHLDSCHLDPILWQTGDGRHGHGILTKEPPTQEYAPYLFWNGYQATPSIRDQKFETKAELRERQRKLDNIIAQALANAPLVENDLEDIEEPLLNNPG